MKPNTWIYWRWKHNVPCVWNAGYVVSVPVDGLVRIADDDRWTRTEHAQAFSLDEIEWRPHE